MSSTAAIYCRISSDRAGAGLGVERQEAECRALAHRRGWAVTEVLVDNDLSAYSGRARPGYQQLLAGLERGDYTAVIAWHPDRLHRSPVELEGFIDLVERTGAAVHTVQGGDYDLSTAAGRMTARVVGAVARHESEHKSERHRAKALQLARAGEVGGGGTRPFGYEPDRRTLRPDEAAVVAEMAQRLLAGETVRGLAADLTRRGVRTVTGAEWTPHVLRRLLISPRIAGLRQHRGQVVGPAVWPGIITEADHQRLVAILTDPARRVNRNPRRYLLTGLVVCGVDGCGAVLVARPREDRRRCYVCAKGPGFHGCAGIRIMAEPLEELVVARLMVRHDHEDLAERLSALVGTRDDIGTLEEISSIEGRLAELAEAWADGELDRGSWVTAQRRLTERLEAARARLTPTQPEGALRALSADEGPLSDRWGAMSFDQRRALLSGTVERILVAKAVWGRNFFDPARVSIAWRW